MKKINYKLFELDCAHCGKPVKLNLFRKILIWIIVWAAGSEEEAFNHLRQHLQNHKH